MLVAFGLAGRVAQEAYHFLDHAELHESCLDGEPYGTSQQHDDEDVGPEHIVDGGYPLSDCFHSLKSYSLSLK